jgi:hypothetical protein
MSINLNRYIHITDSDEFNKKFELINEKPINYKSGLAYFTLTEIQKLVNSKSTIINETGFSTLELVCTIRDNYENKLNLWGIIFDKIASIFIVTNRSKTLDVAKSLISKLMDDAVENSIKGDINSSDKVA